MSNDRIRPQFSSLTFNFGDPLSITSAPLSTASLRLDRLSATGFTDATAQTVHSLESERLSSFGHIATAFSATQLAAETPHRLSHLLAPATEAQSLGGLADHSTLLAKPDNAAISQGLRGISFAHDSIVPGSPTAVHIDDFSPATFNLVLPHNAPGPVPQAQAAVPHPGMFGVGAISGQLWVGYAGDGLGNPDGHSDFRIMHMDADGAADSKIIAQEQNAGGINQTIGLDTSAGLFFSLSEDFHLRVSNINTGSVLSDTVVASTADFDVMNCFAVNPDSNTIFAGLFGYDYLADGGDILKITYNQTTGAITNPYSWNDTTHAFSINLNNVLIDSTSTGHVYADARAMYLTHDDSTLYYVDDNNNDPGNFWGFSTNGVFKVSTTGSVGGGNAPTPVLLSSQAQFPVNDSNGYINGIAVDEARGIIYFTTASTNPSTNPTQNAIWWMPITGGTATKMTIPGGVSVTYPTFFGDPIELDQKNHILYYADQVTGQIVQFILSADGHSFTSASNFFLFDSNHTSDGAYANSMVFDNLPTLSSLSATTTEAVQGGSAITLLTAAASITDLDNQRLNHFTITITNAQTGDNLFCNGAQSGTQSGVTISWNSSTHVLTLSGDVAFSTYQSLLSQISYQDSGTDNSTGSHPTRTINWTASDGVNIVHASTADSNQQTTTVVIDRAPTLTADNYTVVETATVTGTSGTGGTGVLGNDSDKDGDAIVVTQVNGSGANVGNSVAGTYGHLTLNSNGSYSYIADNAVNIAAAATGSHPVDTFTYTVSDGLGGVTSSTVSFTVDRLPTVVADNPATQAVESGGTVSGSVLTNDSDRDGDSLTVSQVNGAGGNVGNSIAGTYGHITINSNGSYSYSADNTVAIDAAATGSHLTDTFTYQASDGHGGTATNTITITLDRPPTVVADSGNAVESASGTGNVLTNDSDRDGDSLTVSAVNGVGGNVGNSVAGTYGHINIASDGGYTYNADITAAIDAAATGSHLTDSFTYTANDAHGGTTTQTITITLDRPPTVSTHNANVAESGTATGTAGTAGTGALGADSDRDGDSIFATKLNGTTINDTLSNFAGTYGHITIGEDGSYNYVADNTAAIDAAATGSHPVDTFTLTVADGHGGTTDETLTFTIDRAAIAQNDSISTNENATVTAATVNTGLLGNDSDPDTGTNAGLAVTAVNGSAGNVGNQITFADGSFVTVNSDGTYTYDPNHAWDFLPAAASGAPSTGTETFQYTITGGSTVTATITINGVDSDDRLIGTAGNDTYSGGIGSDVFSMGDGGNDNVSGGIGDDFFAFADTLTAADVINGGGGSDTLRIRGDYSSGLVLSATSLTSVERLELIAGSSYNLTTNDANVASGNLLTVVATTLGAGDSVLFDGSAETDGQFSIRSGAGNDTLSGGSQSDVFRLDHGGNDTVHGNAGDDTIFMDGAFTAADAIDGGAGSNDRLMLNGDYSTGVTLSATTVTNVERFVLTPGNDYVLTSNDATVAAGHLLTVAGNRLLVGDDVTFNGAAESDGRFDLRGGAGNDHLTGGAQDDIIRLTHGGNDTAKGGGGADFFKLGADLTASDSIDGGGGIDTAQLAGDYSAGLTFGATTMVNVEQLQLAPGYDYTLTTNNATVAAGGLLTVDGRALGAGDSLSFNAAVETDGRLKITGGAGDDNLTGGTGIDVLDGGNGTNTLTGGLGHDLLYAGSGTDTFSYSAALDSTGITRDVIFGFDASADHIDIPGSINAIDTAVTTGMLSTTHFDTNLANAIGAAQLAAHDAILFTPDSGNQSGNTFLVVDLNGTAGYQAGQDLVIQLEGATNLGALAAGTFV